MGQGLMSHHLIYEIVGPHSPQRTFGFFSERGRLVPLPELPYNKEKHEKSAPFHRKDVCAFATTITDGSLV